MLLSGAFKSRSISCNKSNFRAGHGPGPAVVVERPRSPTGRRLPIGPGPARNDSHWDRRTRHLLVKRPAGPPKSLPFR